MNFYQAYYTIVKFIPDLIKNEPINIGLMIHSPKVEYIRTEFSPKKANMVSKYNNDVDPVAVKSIIEDLIENFNNENLILRNHTMGNFSDNNLLTKMFAAHSNQLQFTKPRAIITENIDQEFDRLFSEFVFKEVVSSKEKAIEERTMKTTVKRRFNELGLIKNKLVEENHIEIDRFGDKIKLDFKYLTGKQNLIKNISLDPRNKEPMDHAKLWLKNYEEIKQVSKKEGIDKNIQVIYCLPTDDRNKINRSILSCLEAASDDLIDFRDEEKMNYYVNRVFEIAHN